MRRWLVAGSIALACAFVAVPPVHAVDSGRLVYSDAFGGSGLRILAAGGGGVPRILPGTRGSLRPRWSPDGDRVAYLGPDGAVALADADGAEHHVLFGRRMLPPRWQRIATLAWSPDGSQLVLELQRRRFPPSLFLADLATRRVKLLLRNASQADWSADGHLVAVRGRSLITFHPDGSHVRVVLRDDAIDPEWSPDGSRIVYQRYSGNFDLFVIEADGSGRTNLTRSPAVDWSPTWSPDGSRIAFARSRSLDTYDDLFTMNADGSGVTRLTHTPTIDEYEPDWA